MSNKKVKIGNIKICQRNLNIKDIVGKVIEANVEVVDPRNRFMLPMRKIEL